MISQLQEFLDRLRLDISRATLGAWIALINVAIVVLVVGGISISAIGSLRDLADQQGKARVELAGALAREELRRISEDVLTEARSIAERQTLQRLLGERNQALLEPFLRRSCTSETIAACAIAEGATLIASAGVDVPWPQIFISAAEQGERFMAAPAATEYGLVGASAQVSQRPLRHLDVIRQLDERLGAVLPERVGVQVRLLHYRSYTDTRKSDEFTRLHSAGLSDGRSAVMRIESADMYAASFPVFASTGEAIALLEARLPAREIDTATGTLIKRLLTTAIVLAALAVLAGILLGQQVTGPVSTLTEAAERLGQGDFSTSIPVEGTKEVGKLARTM